MPGPLLDYLMLALAGALLCNAIPHLSAGTRGEPFPTPFAKPRGVGLSSPLTNFLWGSVNLAAGLSLSAGGSALPGRFIALSLGFLAIGLYLSVHFGRVRRDR